MFFIAEIGSNWDGKINLAKETIMAIKRTGVECVKFQMWRQKDLYPDKPEYKKYELTEEYAKELSTYCHQHRMIFFASPFYPEAVDILEELRVPMYKIASRTVGGKDSNSNNVIRKIKQTNKPIIFSNGFFNPTDIEGMELFCIPEYPTEINKFRGMYLNKDGISDHTLGITIPLWYSKHNPNGIIEKHVKGKDNSSPDSPFSITTQELQDFMILSKSFPLKFG